MNSAGHLVLDGANSAASIAGAVVDTSRSFSMHARVRLDSANPSSSMTVMSMSGVNGASVSVGYDATTSQWKVTLTGSDSASPTVIASVLSPVPPTSESAGQAITVVYNGITGDVRLFVDGTVSAPLAEPFLSAWAGTSGLQIGRSLSGGVYGNYFDGSIDDVRVYQGALNNDEVQTLAGSLMEDSRY
nr:hypothetical protein GCM10025732_25840 [Glycomyces mayteni]